MNGPRKTWPGHAAGVVAAAALAALHPGPPVQAAGHVLCAVAAGAVGWLLWSPRFAWSASAVAAAVPVAALAGAASWLVAVPLAVAALSHRAWNGRIMAPVALVACAGVVGWMAGPVAALVAVAAGAAAALAGSWWFRVPATRQGTSSLTRATLLAAVALLLMGAWVAPGMLDDPGARAGAAMVGLAGLAVAQGVALRVAWQAQSRAAVHWMAATSGVAVALAATIVFPGLPSRPLAGFLLACAATQAPAFAGTVSGASGGRWRWVSPLAVTAALAGCLALV